MAYGYIKTLDKNVKRTHIRFINRYGIWLAGDLYSQINLDENKKYPAIIVGAPYGGVKEQGPCVYANQLAKLGYIVLTFDQVYMGESSGDPRNISSVELFTESFSAAVDYLGVKVKYVDRKKIGVIGICGSGGFALAAAQADPRIKGVVTASMYDMTVAARLGQNSEQIQKNKKQLALQRWLDAENGYPEYIPSFPEQPLDFVPPLEEPTAEWFRFYAVKRGHHPSARGGFSTTSNIPFINFNLLSHLDEISPRPILFIVGENAHSIFFSKEAFDKAKDPKELYVVKGAEHIDLYDQEHLIPFEKINEFFKKAFN